MSDDTKKIIRVSPESDKAIRAYATKRGIEVTEAADALIATGVSRINALTRYKKSTAKEAAAKAPGKPKKAKAAKKSKARASANGASAHA